MPCSLSAHARCREKAGSAGKIETIAVIAGSQRAGPRCRRRQWYRRVREIGAAPKGSRRTGLERTGGRTSGGTRFRIAVRGVSVWRIKLGFTRSLCRRTRATPTSRDIALTPRFSHIFVPRFRSLSPPATLFCRQRAVSILLMTTVK